MKKTMMTAVILASFLAAAAPSRAGSAEIPELTRFVSDEISTMSRAVESGGDGADTPSRVAFYFRQFAVRVRASVGIEVPWIVSFAIVPEVELVWNREMKK